MKLRPTNVSRRSLLADFQHAAESALSYADRKYADRNGDGAVQRLNKRFYDMTVAPDSDSLPSIHDFLPAVGSSQSVIAFAPVVFGDTVHPDDTENFDPSELSEVIEAAAARRICSPGLYKHVDWVTPEGGESQHGEMVGFMSESQEKADIAHKKLAEDRQAKAKRRAERAGLKFQEIQASGDPAAIEEMATARKNAGKFSEITRELKREIHDRLKYGHYHPGAKRLGGNVKIAGELYEEFHEYFCPECPYRSKLGSPSLARMPALYPRNGLVRAGNDKEALLETTSKLLAMDSPYVELNRLWAGCITIELDSVWRSAAELRAKLLTIFGPTMMPNLVVGRYTRDGLFARPHLIWVLKTPVYYNPHREWTDPDTGEVKSSGDENCRPGPIAKFHAVQRSLVSMLLPLGADPACHNIWKPKNPLSPFWSTVIANDDHWASLDEFRHVPGYPKRAPSEHKMADLAHKMREKAAGEAPVTSNLIWATAKREIGHLVNRGRAGLDLDFRRAADQGQEALAAFIDNNVRPALEATLGESPALDRVLLKQCPFAARIFRRMRHKITKYTKIKKDEDGNTVRRPAWRGRDSSFFVMTPEIDASVDDERRVAIEAEIKKTECTKRRQHAGARSGASNGNKTYWWFGQCLVAWLSEASDPSWAAFRVSRAYDCCENTARKYWSKFHADSAAAQAANAAKAATVSSSLPTQNGDVRYIAKPSSSQNITSNLPSEVQQAIPSIVPGHPQPGYQFDTSDPSPDHHRSTVNRPNPSGPPVSSWQSYDQSTAEVHPVTNELCPEPA